MLNVTPAKNTGRRILIAEDNGIISTYLDSTLTRLDYEVVDVVAHGEDVLRIMSELRQANAALPNLVLMDICLAGELDGIEAAAQIRAQYDVPVIYLTAYSDTSLLQQARIAEPYGYLVKPVQDRELYAAIEMALYRHKLEAQLKERERWLEATLHSIGDAVIATDEQGRVIFLNPVAEGLTGWQEADALHHNLGEVLRIAGQDTSALAADPARLAQALHAQVIAGPADYTSLITRDGTEIPIDGCAAPIRGAQEDATGVVVAFRDITARVQAEEKARKLHEELEERVIERTLQLETAHGELETFAYSISHDLRSPLRAIQGFPQILLEDYAGQLDAEAQDYLRRMSNAAQRMGELIDGLLVFLRLGRRTLEKESVAPMDLVRRVLGRKQGELLQRQVVVMLDELPPCQADPVLLEWIFDNLLSNALKYTRQREQAQIQVGCKHENGHDVYFVQDNGVGFDMQYAPQIFGMFQRLHHADEYEGTGIGLAIVQRIVQRHGGRVWAEAQEGHGATFYFTL